MAFIYVGTKPCGCIVAAIVDDPRWIKDTAKTVAGYIKDGYTVSRVEQGSVTLAHCTHGTVKEQQQVAQPAKE